MINITPDYPLRSTDLLGHRFGRWTVIKYSGAKIFSSKSRSRYWLCRCDCGIERETCETNLKRGLTSSCGCIQREYAIKPRSAHGHARRTATNPIHNSWSAMKQRCLNPNSEYWAEYGGRGISICHKWLSYSGFLEDMVSSWAHGLEIERINVNGNYEKSNCTWATRNVQARNRRCVKFYDIDGNKMTLGEAADHIGLSIGALNGRLLRGWPLERVFERSKYGKPI